MTRAEAPALQSSEATDTKSETQPESASPPSPESLSASLLEALDHIGKHGMPDVVVLDINMPVMDGLEFLAHFKGDRHATPARVVIVTTEGREDDFKRGLAAGASAYLRKPFTPEALVDLLQGLLAKPVRAGAGT